MLNEADPETPFVGQIADLKVLAKDGTHLPVAYVNWYHYFLRLIEGKYNFFIWRRIFADKNRFYNKYHLSQKLATFANIFSERE